MSDEIKLPVAIDGRLDLLQHLREQGLTVHGSADGNLALVTAPGAWNGRHAWAQYYGMLEYWLITQPDRSRMRITGDENWIGVKETKVRTIDDAEPLIEWLRGGRG